MNAKVPLSHRPTLAPDSNSRSGSLHPRSLSGQLRGTPRIVLARSWLGRTYEGEKEGNARVHASCARYLPRLHHIRAQAQPQRSSLQHSDLWFKKTLQSPVSLSKQRQTRTDDMYSKYNVRLCLHEELHLALCVQVRLCTRVCKEREAADFILNPSLLQLLLRLSDDATSGCVYTTLGIVP